jgi:hypothetical protein
MLQAQDQAGSRGTFTIGTGYYMVGGQDFSGTDNALGVDVRGGFDPSPAARLSFGLHYSSHSIGLPNRSLGIYAAYFEPRLVFGRGVKQQRTFLGARLAWLHRDASIPTAPLSGGGYGIGALTGFSQRISGNARLEFLITATYLSFNSLFPPGPSQTGNTIGLECALDLPVVASH